MKNVLLINLCIILLFFIAQNLYSQNMIWEKKLGGTTDIDVHSVEVDGSGNVYIGGSFNTSTVIDGTTENRVNGSATQTMFILKYNSTGTKQWIIKMDGVTSFNTSPLEMVSGASHLYVTGSFSGTVDFDPGAGATSLTSAGATDIFVAKYLLSNGNLVWAYQGGSTDTDIGYALDIDGAENVYIAGGYRNTVDFDFKALTGKNSSAVGGAVDEIFVAKYNTNGDYQWHVSAGSAGVDVAFGVKLDASDNVFVVGQALKTATGNQPDFNGAAAGGQITTNTNDKSDAFLVKYNSSGTFQWVKNISNGNDDNRANAIDIDGSSNIYVAGYFKTTSDFDPSITTNNLISAGGQDAFVAKYDANGNYVWAYKMGNTGFDDAKSIKVNNFGAMVIGGYISEVTDMNPEGTGGTQNRGAATDRYDFIGEYNADFKYQWCHGMGNADDFSHSTQAVAIDKNDATVPTYAFGYFEGTVDFDPNNAGGNLVGNADVQDDGFLVKYGTIILPIELLYFNAKKKGNGVVLEWQTASEINNDYFTIEKSLDVQNWKEVTTVAGAGNSNQVLNYITMDKKPYQGISYYRLKQTDFNGKYAHSDIVSISYDSNTKKKLVTQLVVSNNKIEIWFKERIKEQITLQIIDVSGKKILNRKLNSSINNHFQTQNISHLVAGVYFLNIISPTQSYSTKFIQQ